MRTQDQTGEFKGSREIREDGKQNSATSQGMSVDDRMGRMEKMLEELIRVM